MLQPHAALSRQIVNDVYGEVLGASAEDRQQGRQDAEYRVRQRLSTLYNPWANMLWAWQRWQWQWLWAPSRSRSRHLAENRR